MAAVAHRAGITGDPEGDPAGSDRGPGGPRVPAIDARQLPDHPDELADTLESATVFGRVDPHQKRAMVQALQSRGRTVAMTGDGVNDVLALKDADMGIAMGTGSSAARAVAQLVLLDNRFATLPRVLAEGRRVINNIETGRQPVHHQGGLRGAAHGADRAGRLAVPVPCPAISR